jgi:hypothetical protein
MLVSVKKNRKPYSSISGLSTAEVRLRRLATTATVMSASTPAATATPATTATRPADPAVAIELELLLCDAAYDMSGGLRSSQNLVTLLLGRTPLHSV